MHQMELLAQVDQAIQLLLEQEPVDSALLAKQLHERKTILQDLQSKPEQLDPEQWNAAIQRTQVLLAEIQCRRDNSAKQLQQLKHGQRSVQAYNKFR